MLRRKKALCAIKWKSARRLKLLYPLQCHKYCHHSRKGPWGGVGGKAGFLTGGGPAGEPAAPGGLSCKNRKEPTFPGCVPGSTLQERDSLSLTVWSHIAAEDAAAWRGAQFSCSVGAGWERAGRGGWNRDVHGS